MSLTSAKRRMRRATRKYNAARRRGDTDGMVKWAAEQREANKQIGIEVGTARILEHRKVKRHKHIYRINIGTLRTKGRRQKTRYACDCGKTRDYWEDAR